MQKKYKSGGLILLAFVLMVVPGQGKQSVKFTPAFGTMWDQGYLWSLGLSVDLYPIHCLSITPEFFMANKKIGLTVSKDEDYTFFLQPGVMFNYHHPSFFVGAGVVKSYQARNAWHYEGWDFPRKVVWNVVWSNVWKLKLNAGFKISQIRFTLFFLENFKDLGWFPTAAYNAYGAVIGYTF